MIDLRILRDRWTEEGGRATFAELVTHCVRSIHPGAHAVRPDPGDEGLDTFVGEFDGDLHVFQAKYFCDALGASRHAQVREAIKACMSSGRFSHIVSWTLCIPLELSPEEHSWWQGWRKRQSAKYDCQIELWARSRFQAFSCQPELIPIFKHALGRGHTHSAVSDVLVGMRGSCGPLPIEALPTEDYRVNAIFVRKLERAGWMKRRGARTAFYNFELLRAAVEQGGNPVEQASSSHTGHPDRLPMRRRPHLGAAPLSLPPASRLLRAVAVAGGHPIEQ